MPEPELRTWLNASPRRSLVVGHLGSPLTATHLARRTGIPRAACSRILSILSRRRLTRCLNLAARRSRLYGLTREGRSLLPPSVSSAVVSPPAPSDWSTLGWLAFRHRSAILRTLSHPMQPAEIKRRARLHDPTLRMSAGNVREVIRLMLGRGIVARIEGRKHAHPRYQLTEAGRSLRQLLLDAEGAA